MGDEQDPSVTDVCSPFLLGKEQHFTLECNSWLCHFAAAFSIEAKWDKIKCDN